MTSATTQAQTQVGLQLTALDRYVQEPDPRYRYSVLEVVAGKGAAPRLSLGAEDRHR
ncbi:MAG: hypothetical protein O3C29_14860 [Proteobacteria bacterium]|nr:hypothetical protein [Pseudomonadota bacterium]MDA1291765.1 hypothetical protein [Pseudomonadota bacterium]